MRVRQKNRCRPNLAAYYDKGPSGDGLIAHHARLIEQVGRYELRVFLYHFPQMSQVPFSTDLVLRLRAEFGPIIAGPTNNTARKVQVARLGEWARR